MTSPNETPQTAEVAKATAKLDAVFDQFGLGDQLTMEEYRNLKDSEWPEAKANLIAAIRTESSARAREQEARTLTLPVWVGERAWVCLCARPANLLDTSHSHCVDCGAKRPAGATQ